MKFLADQEIPYVKEAFSTIGEVELLPASKITGADLQSADGLIIRTTTKIRPPVLDRCAVRFVGTATIGTDHIDLPYLLGKKIAFASAPGCNAVAVAEFVLNGLITYAHEHGISLQDQVLGIIGAGNTGSALKKRAEILGITCLLNDPPLKEKTRKEKYIPIRDLVEHSSIISLHVPLTKDVKHPTYHLIDDRFLKNVTPDTIIVNTSRGEVIDEKSLVKYRSNFRGLLLDVWENEPNIDFETLRVVDIATSHVAGYSMEGKIRATEMIYNAACNCFGLISGWSSKRVLEDPVRLAIRSEDQKHLLKNIIMQAFDIRKDDTMLRKITAQSDPGGYFSVLRNKYRFRREFGSLKLGKVENLPVERRKTLAELGFDLTD
ncbi:MAG: 4-phosphoerythronate dehydrogenase [Proteobacteria bacterium]|nr:4-phosphoerythronate dehydrogenase [Pseudomonadota bacterium]